ncbi:MAG TPA: radical SAM protein [Acidobacteriota bacterium]|nr:radical SAM protein [Acidobacteriota bacterium]HRV08764.1 radical SAM protein [Acidobacteriota bacterium]
MSLRRKIIYAWGRILLGYAPVLSIEITRRCPLSCPGCYAFAPGHVSGKGLREMTEFTGRQLVDEVLHLVDQNRPLGVFIVGGEPLVRYRELELLLPELVQRGVEVEVVTSAVRPIPQSWSRLPGLGLVVSIDGPREIHDRRRAPATYDRILKNIAGHRIIVHCTITRELAEDPQRLQEFLLYWNGREEVGTIRLSFYTPQLGESSDIALDAELHRQTVELLAHLHPRCPKLRWTAAMAESYLRPPKSPARCIFAQVTDCFSADLRSRVEPCQLGGRPDCTRCGCVAAAGLKAVGDTALLGPLRVGHVFQASLRIGRILRRIRNGWRREVDTFSDQPTVLTESDSGRDLPRARSA